MSKERKDDTPAEDAKEKEVKMSRDGKEIMVDPDAIEDYKERGWKMVKEAKENPFDKKGKKDEDEDESEEDDEDEDESEEDDEDEDEDEDDKKDMKESVIGLALSHKPQEFGEAIKSSLFDRVRDAIDTQRVDAAQTYLSTATTEE